MTLNVGGFQVLYYRNRRMGRGLNLIKLEPIAKTILSVGVTASAKRPWLGILIFHLRWIGRGLKIRQSGEKWALSRHHRGPGWKEKDRHAISQCTCKASFAQIFILPNSISSIKISRPGHVMTEATRVGRGRIITIPRNERQFFIFWLLCCSPRRRKMVVVVPLRIWTTGVQLGEANKQVMDDLPPILRFKWTTEVNMVPPAPQIHSRRYYMVISYSRFLTYLS